MTIRVWSDVFSELHILIAFGFCTTFLPRQINMYRCGTRQVLYWHTTHLSLWTSIMNNKPIRCANLLDFTAWCQPSWEATWSMKLNFECPQTATFFSVPQVTMVMVVLADKGNNCITQTPLSQKQMQNTSMVKTTKLLKNKLKWNSVKHHSEIVIWYCDGEDCRPKPSI